MRFSCGVWLVAAADKVFTVWCSKVTVWVESS
jgi:hypothetical protein